MFEYWEGPLYKWEKCNRDGIMVLCFPQNLWNKLLPEDCLKISNPLLRSYEWHLREMIYRWEHFHDDFVTESVIKVPFLYSNTGWGVGTRIISSNVKGGAYAFDPPIKKPDDISKLRFPEIKVNEEKNRENFETIYEILGDIMEVKLEKIGRIWLGLPGTPAKLRGIGQFMLDMIERPRWVHRLMNFFMEGEQRLLQSMEEASLLELTNGNDFVGSGGLGYTDELPAPGFDGKHVRLHDVWGMADAQEVAHISPSMHDEFILQYQIPLLEKFGLNQYGCCEPLTDRLDIVKKIPRLRRISVSPWANVGIAAEILKDEYIFSWKPNPTYLSSTNFDTEWIKKYTKKTLDATDGCVLEIIMKDLETCNDEPERLDIWTKIVQELIAEREC